MKLFNILILILPLTFFAEEITYKEGDSFESVRSHSVVLYAYKADARRVNNALQFSFNAHEFMKYAAVDSRDIYKVRRGDAFVLTESIKDGDIFKVNLSSKRINNEKYFILSKDLKDNSLSQLETGT
jgi:hypothetical protein|tara:strand:+ start:107 stop:487 length:381 start_codon:yes stop_codon:yes gene_type:complete